MLKLKTLEKLVLEVFLRAQSESLQNNGRLRRNTFTEVGGLIISNFFSFEGGTLNPFLDKRPLKIFGYKMTGQK